MKKGYCDCERLRVYKIVDCDDDMICRKCGYYALKHKYKHTVNAGGLSQKQKNEIEKQNKEMARLWESGMKQTDIGKLYGISGGHVSVRIRGENRTKIHDYKGNDVWGGNFTIYE